MLLFQLPLQIQSERGLRLGSWGPYNPASPPPPPALRLAVMMKQSNTTRARNFRKASSRLGSEFGLGFPDTPLYPGYGTHFSYVWVGTPPQRVSVIIDTGSHYTAFPCVGCDNCGKHTDPYFDLKKSKTARVTECGKGKCEFRQSYSEGSSWTAFKVHDKLWVGAETVDLLNGSPFSLNFMFGCQTSETGLFRTQLADGIMGMSAQHTTLVPQLKEAGLLEHNLFALCFMVGGGSMTLGGVDMTLHTSQISYTPMTKATGWYTIELHDITVSGKSIDAPASKFNSGKGIIVDSGTTDTYLPRAVEGALSTALANAGLPYTTEKFMCSDKKYSRFPNISFHFKGGVIVTMPPYTYLDKVGPEKCVFRVYLTESSGGVLGANFMRDHNVIFDMENRRVGFATADCSFSTHNVMPSFPPTPVPRDTRKRCVLGERVPVGPCNATCGGPLESGVRSGFQIWSVQKSAGDDCPDPVLETTACSVTCVKGMSVHGTTACPFEPWSKCDGACRQSRRYGTILLSGSNGKACRKDTESRQCSVGLCPPKTGDWFVVMDIKLSGMTSNVWAASSVKDDYLEAVAKVLDVDEGTVEIMASHDALSDDAAVAHMQFQLRVVNQNLSDSASEVLTFYTASDIRDRAHSPAFPDLLVKQLNAIGRRWGAAEAQYRPRLPNDLEENCARNLSSRYGWINPHMVVVSHVSATPLNNYRAPIAIPQSAAVTGEGGAVASFSAFLTGIAVVSVILAAVTLAAHLRLRKVYHSIVISMRNSRGSGGSMEKMKQHIEWEAMSLTNEDVHRL